ncbi:tetratricopeptide repeat protein [Mycobacteroides abscessus]|uniref:tetratricopeptide repeat protein n=1 Tax=Mycobacteroides abscessus TaxID=36809 RepID=UPI0019CFC033|nr:tetratricopeptide repeat protein [Mycobacteroides abscessus]MBN7558923.1 ATP-binding protein [Mycobacteroides abscessus subsp. abscessus]
MEIEGTRRDSSGQDIRISAKDGGVAAYRIDKVVVEGVSESKVATELFPIDALVGEDAPFVGRNVELRRLRELLCATGELEAPVIVVAGPPGVGKTALLRQATQAAHEAGLFHCALFADLRGYDTDPNKSARPDSILPQLLLHLGMHDAEIPPDATEQLLLYRKKLNQLAGEGKPFLLWLDNVSDRAQFDSLRPTASIHKLVITTRETFGHIPQRQVVKAKILLPPESAELLSATVKYRSPLDPRLRDEPAMVAALAELCSHLPLALQIVAALVTDEPDRPLAELVSELAHEEGRLNSLECSPDFSVRAAFFLSYRRLPLNLQRLFRLLSVVPGGDIGLDVGGWLLAEPARAVRPHLMALVRSHLVQQHRLNRWSMHDLIRLYSSELSSHEAEDAEQAFVRVVLGYRYGLDAADKWLTTTVSSTAKEVFVSPEEASAWFEAEKATAIATVTNAARKPALRDSTLSLISTLARLLRRQHHWLNELHDVTSVGASLAPYTQSRALAGTALNIHGATLRLMGRTDDAIDVLYEALKLARANNDTASFLMVATNITNAFMSEGLIDEAIDLHQQNIDLCRELTPPDPSKLALALTNLGVTYVQAERHSDALPPLREAYTIRHRLDDMPGLAEVAVNLGGTLSRLGRDQSDHQLLKEAAVVLKTAAEIHARRGNTAWAAYVANNLGITQCALGQRDEGIGNLKRALEYFVTAGLSDRAEEARRTLHRIQGG